MVRNTTRTYKSLQNEKEFEEYINKIVEILKSKGIEMIKEGSGSAFSFQSHNDKENCARIGITFVYNIDYKQRFDLFVVTRSITRPHYRDINSLEGMIIKKTEDEISKKYPLSNFSIRVNSEESGRPHFKPVKETAEQLYLALKCHNKRNESKTISKIKKVEKRISKFLEKESDVIVESFFQ